MNLVKSLFAYLLLFSTIANAQTQYQIKLKTDYLHFSNRGLRVEPGPNWKGYYLPKKENGISLNVVNGIVFRNRFFVGLGLGYLNFEGINGLTAFADFEYYFLKKKKLKPFLNLNIGYSHIWNQYSGGTSTALSSFEAGLQYQFSKNMSLGFQSGFLYTQQAFFYPVRLSFSIRPKIRDGNTN